MLKKGIQVMNSNVLVMDFTFKENCPDVRNTKVIDIVNNLKYYSVNVCIYDPWTNPEVACYEYGVEILNELPNGHYDAVILVVIHDKFRDLGITKITNEIKVVYDMKGVLSKEVIDARL